MYLRSIKKKKKVEKEYRSKIHSLFSKNNFLIV